MNKHIIVGLILLTVGCSLPVMAQGNGGTLNIFGSTGIYKVFLDNEDMGETPLKLDGIQSGSHFIKALSGEAVVHEEIVEIKDDELTTIVIAPGQEIKKPEVKYVAVQENKPKGPDYSEKTFKGPYLTVGYLSNSFSDYGSSYYGVSGSGLNLGMGYKYSPIPHLDMAVEVSRSNFSSRGVSWYVMPLSLNVSYSMSNENIQNNKYYYGISITNLITDLNDSGSYQGGTAWGWIFGYESPAWADAAFFEYALSSKRDPNAFISYFRIGYRWNKVS